MVIPERVHLKRLYKVYAGCALLAAQSDRPFDGLLARGLEDGATDTLTSSVT